MEYMAQDGDLTHSGGPSLLTQMSSDGCKKKMGFMVCTSQWPGPRHHPHLSSLASGRCVYAARYPVGFLEGYEDMGEAV